jgi:replicative DNA helicase
VSRALKRMALDLDVLVIAASQLNRASDQRKDGRPRLNDLRESGAQEQDADVVLLLHQEDRKDDETELIVAKHRNRGRGTTKLRFDGAVHRFYDLGGSS